MKSLLGIFDIVPGWAWALICACALATAAVQTARVERVKAQAAETKAHYAEVARKAEAANRQQERQHAQDLTAADKRKADETRALALSVARLTDELRKRPDRPAAGAVSTSPAGPMGCTGASLYRPDAAFLVGESARADKLRIDLAECREKYDSAVKLTNP